MREALESESDDDQDDGGKSDESRLLSDQDAEIVLLVESAGELLPVWFDGASGAFDPYDVGDDVLRARNAAVVAILARVQRIVSKDVPVDSLESMVLKNWRHD